MAASIESKSSEPSLQKGQVITFRRHDVLIDQFLRWGPLLEDHCIEIYRAKLTPSHQQDPSLDIRTLHKISYASESLLTAALEELNVLKFIRRCGGHPNIARLADSAFMPTSSSGNDSSEKYDIYYLFEDEEIGTLADILRARRRDKGKISELELLEIILPVCEAVSFLHSFRPSLVHRSIRLTNIVMTGNDTLQLSGFFGVALELAPETLNEEDLPLLIEDLACYTIPRYRAPEVQYPSISLGITTKSDVWSIGVVLYTAAFRKGPFARDDPLSISSATFSYPHTRYPRVTGIIDTLLQINPVLRPSASDLCGVLTSILNIQTTSPSGYIKNIGSSFKVKEFAMPRRSYLCPVVNQKPPPAPPKLMVPISSFNAPSSTAHQTSERRNSPHKLWGYESVLSEYQFDQNTGFLNDTPSALEPDPDFANSTSRSRRAGKGHYYSSSSPFSAWSAIGIPSDHQEAKSTDPPTPDLGERNTQLDFGSDSDEATAVLAIDQFHHPYHSDESSWGDKSLGSTGLRPLRGRGSAPSDADPLEPVKQGNHEARSTSTSREYQKAMLDASSLPASDTAHSHQEVRGKLAEARVDMGCDLEPTKHQEVPEISEPEDPVIVSPPGSTLVAEDNGQAEQHLSPRPAEISTGGPPPRTPSPLVDDIGPFIVYISPDPVNVNGHFCDVFEGSHIRAGKVALKRPRMGTTGYDKVVIRRFEREAMTWRTLRHPHILEFLGTFKRGEYLYFVSPFINNGTLIEHVAGHPEVNRIKLLYQAADAVSYLHQHMIVHGDIKGSNILIGDNGHSLLCDFGLTKMTHSRTSTALRGAGTVRWQSPELWDDEPKSLSSDVYAFGMTIAEVLTDDVPFAHLKSNPSVILAVMGKNTRPFKAPLQSSTGISYQNAWEVAEACWSKQPEDRISMLVAFQRLLADPSLS